MISGQKNSASERACASHGAGAGGCHCKTSFFCRGDSVGSVVSARSGCAGASLFAAYRSLADMLAAHASRGATICVAATVLPTESTRPLLAGSNRNQPTLLFTALNEDWHRCWEVSSIILPHGAQRTQSWRELKVLFDRAPEQQAQSRTLRAAVGHG